MTGPSRVRLGTVAEVGSGSGFPKGHQGIAGEKFPFLKVSDMNLPGNETYIRRWNNTVSDAARRQLGAKAYPAGSVIFPKIGAAIATNKKRILTRPSCIDNNVMAVTPQDSEIISEFVHTLLLRKNLTDFASQSNPPSMRKAAVEDWEIPLPSLEEQRRIVDILNHAASIRRLRAHAKAKAKELIPGLFLDMFGDPAINPRGWDVRRLGEFVAEFRYGTSQKCYEETSDEGLPVLRIPNVLGGAVLWSDLKSAILPARDRERLLLRPGDLLFVRTNGNPAYIGRCAVFDSNRPAAFASYLIRARIGRGSQILPEFIRDTLMFPTYRPNILRSARTTAGNYNISIEGLSDLQIVEPPLERQRSYLEHVTDIQATIDQMDRAAAAAEHLQAALMARLFAGE